MFTRGPKDHVSPEKLDICICEDSPGEKGLFNGEQESDKMFNGRSLHYPQTRIFGGRNITDPQTVPWQVMIRPVNTFCTENFRH